jgi:hypothetical protein
MSDTNAVEQLSQSEVHSFCRHLGRTLKGIGETDAALAMHMMRESEYLKSNGFQNASEMFAVVAATLDPSLPVKMEHARRRD